VQVRGQTRAGCALAALLSTTCTASLRGLGAEGCWLSRDAWRRRRPPAGAGAKAAAPAAESARATHTRRALRAMLPQRPVPPRPRGAAGGLQYFLASAPSTCTCYVWCFHGVPMVQPHLTVVKNGSEHQKNNSVRPLVNGRQRRGGEGAVSGWRAGSAAILLLQHPGCSPWAARGGDDADVCARRIGVAARWLGRQALPRGWGQLAPAGRCSADNSQVRCSGARRLVTPATMIVAH